MILYLTYLFSIYDSSISFHNEEKMNEKRIFWIWFASDLQRIMYIFCLQQCWENSRKDSFFVCALTLFPHIYFLLWYAQSTQKTLFTFMLLFAVVIILRILYVVFCSSTNILLVSYMTRLNQYHKHNTLSCCNRRSWILTLEVILSRKEFCVFYII